MDDSNQPKNTGATPKRDILYSEAAKYAPRAIEVLADIMENGDSDSNRMGAAKAIPDLKVLELGGPDGGPIQLLYRIDMAGGYIPPLGVINASSGASNTGPTPLQSVGLAQTSQEDNNSDNRDNKAGTV